MNDTDLMKLLETINEYLSEKEYKKISDLLQETDVRNASKLELIAKLRYSYCRWYRIETWISFRDRVKEELDRRNENTEELMYGLFDLVTPENKSPWTKTLERDYLGFPE